MHTIDIEQKQLHSVLQPIYSFSNQTCIGVEALVRGKSLSDGTAVPVYECLKEPEDMDKKEFTRQLNTMHLRNWSDLGHSDTWLFLNLDFFNLHSISDLCLDGLLEELNINPRRVVIEVVESEVKDEVVFEQLITVLRGLGCLIALDDFGAGHSNVDRIWSVEPDIVKLDRTILLEATKSVRSQSVLRNLTKLIQQAGSIALLEGIETQEQALLAMDVGVDLVQGFYFARPGVDATMIESGESLVRSITDEYPNYQKEKDFLRNIQKNGYQSLFEKLGDLHTVTEVEGEMTKHSRFSFVKRFFLLDKEGYQVSDESLLDSSEFEERQVLIKGKGMCWKNRRYFHKAMSFPNDIYISEPYRSLIDMQLCLTIAKVIDIEGERHVACYDVFYHDKSTDSVQIST